MCARVGCMPSKLLIAAAEARHAIDAAPVFGIRAKSVDVDGVAVMQRVRALRDDFVGSVLAGIAKVPADQKLAGMARFLDPHTLQVGDQRVEAARIILATGSHPVVPAAFGKLGDRLLTTDTVFELPALPASLAIVGGGADRTGTGPGLPRARRARAPVPQRHAPGADRGSGGHRGRHRLVQRRLALRTGCVGGTGRAHRAPRRTGLDRCRRRGPPRSVRLRAGRRGTPSEPRRPGPGQQRPRPGRPWRAACSIATRCAAATATSSSPATWMPIRRCCMSPPKKGASPARMPPRSRMCSRWRARCRWRSRSRCRRSQRSENHWPTATPRRPRSVRSRSKSRAAAA